MRSRCLKSLERPSISALTNLIEERNKVDVIDTTLPGVQLITPRRFSDNRGFFAETYNQRAYADLGISDIFQFKGNREAPPKLLAHVMERLLFFVRAGA